MARFVRAGPRQQAGVRWTWRWDPMVRRARRAPSPSAEFRWSTLPRGRCPTLDVRGAESAHAPLDLAERIVAALPDGHLANIPHAGPFPWYENPTAIEAVVREFLSQG